jgi:hypothetical protein
LLEKNRDGADRDLPPRTWSSATTGEKTAKAMSAFGGTTDILHRRRICGAEAHANIIKR